MKQYEISEEEIAHLKKLNGREMKALFILSIVVPMGLLATLRLTGILKGPVVISERMTLQPIVWTCERPALDSVIPNNSARANYSNGELTFTQLLVIGDYYTDLYGGPSTFLGVRNFTASVRGGFVQHMEIVFRENNTSSWIGLFNEGIDRLYGNLKLDKPVDINYLKKQNLVENDTKALLSFTVIDELKQVYVAEGPVMVWVLYSQYNQTHHVEIDTRIVYSNGTVYKEVIQPFDLTLGPDNNNSLENAEQITFGEHQAYIDNGADPVDYYKILLEQGQEVRVSMKLSELNLTPPVGMEAEIRVYDPNGHITSMLFYGKNGTMTQLTVNIDLTGWWYIQINVVIPPPMYILSVSNRT